MRPASAVVSALVLCGGCRGSAANSNEESNATEAMCEARSEASGWLVQNAVRDHQHCETHSDCEHVPTDTDCRLACGALVGIGGKQAVSAAVEQANTAICSDFEADGCERIAPPCVPPLPFATCVGRGESAHCEFAKAAPAQDAGSPSEPADSGTPGDAGSRPVDAAMPENPFDAGDPSDPLDAGNPTVPMDASQPDPDDPESDAEVPEGPCLKESLWWGKIGGLPNPEHRFWASPCRAFRYQRQEHPDRTIVVNCANQIAVDAPFSIDEIQAALGHPDMVRAVAMAPVLYGFDNRGNDGPLYRIIVADKTIDIGQKCRAGQVCTPIPAGVESMRTLLDALGTQQRAVGECIGK